ncbi:hypothetical protein [Streptomyces sp. NPDC001843]|uniref:hypothetical protein n=1 Tax=Streptomyces sp. NPDC001843 TaxID=3364617 RepID=UPI0036889E4E
MQMVGKSKMAKLLSVAAAAVSIAVQTAGPAAAADDGHLIKTDPSPCGGQEFVDYGPGAAGGGDNDDYFLIHDYCSDGHGVKAWAWQNGTYLGGKYNGNGLNGAAVVWDPFINGNVAPGDAVGMKVCLVDGDSDPTPFDCKSYTFTSQDG